MGCLKPSPNPPAPPCDGRNRWGDYSATALDPRDGQRFWTIQQWASAPDIWSTQLTEIRLVPAPTAITAASVTARASAASDPLPQVDFGTLTAGNINNGAAVQNGAFMIAPDLALGDSGSVRLGDGQDETTLLSFNFAEDARYLTFLERPTTTALDHATLSLTVFLGADCATDTFRLAGLGPIRLVDLFPVISTSGCTGVGNPFTGTAGRPRRPATAHDSDQSTGSHQ